MTKADHRFDDDGSTRLLTRWSTSTGLHGVTSQKAVIFLRLTKMSKWRVAVSALCSSCVCNAVRLATVSLFVINEVQ
jgi:hypothetical protein